jgi:hypothetical protein
LMASASTPGHVVIPMKYHSYPERISNWVTTF